METDGQPGRFAKVGPGPREVQAELAEWVRRLRAWDSQRAALAVQDEGSLAVRRESGEPP